MNVNRIRLCTNENPISAALSATWVNIPNNFLSYYQPLSCLRQDNNSSSNAVGLRSKWSLLVGYTLKFDRQCSLRCDLLQLNWVGCFEWATLMGYSDGPFWWAILMGHFDGLLWRDILMGHFDGPLWWAIFMGHSVGSFWLAILLAILISNFNFNTIRHWSELRSIKVCAQLHPETI